MSVLLNLGILVAGITCFIENTDLIKTIGFGVSAISLFISFITGFFKFIGNIFKGYFGFFDSLIFLVSYVGLIIEILAIVFMAILVLLKFKNISNKLRKYWYVPAGLLFVSTLVGIITSIVMALIYGAFSFSMIFNIIGSIIISLIGIVGFAGLGLSISEDVEIKHENHNVEI